MGYGKDGIEDIKSHEFFKDIDWDRLYKKEIKPPYVPKISSQLDLSNIDKTFTREAPKETPDDRSTFLSQAISNNEVDFDDFSYKNDFLGGI